MGTFKGMKYLFDVYRKGEQRHVGLPPLKADSKRVLRGNKRNHVVSEVIDLLKGWKSSHFEFEGAARAGLRTGLVLAGTRWPAADFEAAEIVAEGLRVIGAKRPDWEEAQRRYVDRGDFCVRCGRPMPDELVSGGRNQRFCSVICAEAETLERDTGILAHQNNILNDARRLITREKLPTTICSWCGKPFRPLSPNKYGTQQFCSNRCRGAAMVTTAPVACLACGTVFQPKNRGNGSMSKFCSMACSNAFGKSTRYEKVCLCCGRPFIAKRPDTAFCSRRCLRFVSDWREGTRVPKRVTDLLFDYLFTAPAALAGPTSAAERSERMFLTAGLFDQLCAA